MSSCKVVKEFNNSNFLCECDYCSTILSESFLKLLGELVLCFGNKSLKVFKKDNALESGRSLYTHLWNFKHGYKDGIELDKIMYDIFNKL